MTEKERTTKAPAASEATKTVSLIASGEKKELLKYVPKGQSPKIYIDLIKSQIMRPAKDGTARPDEDLLLFLYVAKRTGLDPLTKQIYAVYRWDTRVGKEVMSIQAGIDGMRLVAQRTKQYAGSDDIKYLPVDESTDHPTKATATVYKIIDSQRVEFSASARWAEYVQVDREGKPMGLWAKMPYNQLGKCAEALALRKGFPNELSGVYSEEEMAQSNNPLANLAAPDKFKKPEPEEVVTPGANIPGTIVVTGGQPSDNSQMPPVSATTAPVVTPENIDGLAGALVEDNGGNDQPSMEPKKPEPRVEPKPEAKDTTPDFGAMRAKIKPKEVK